MKFAEWMDDQTIKLYHGGTKWTIPELMAPRKGRYEAGPGIYLTTSYETARKYAKGSKIVSIVEVSKDIKFAHQISIATEHIVYFLNQLTGLRNRKKIIDDIKSHADRLHSNVVKAQVIINLFVNHEAGSGNTGIKLAHWLVENGVDAALERQTNGEDWVVMMNLKKILKVIPTKPKDISGDRWNLPGIKD